MQIPATVVIIQGIVTFCCHILLKVKVAFFYLQHSNHGYDQLLVVKPLIQSVTHRKYKELSG